LSGAITGAPSDIGCDYQHGISKWRKFFPHRRPWFIEENEGKRSNVNLATNN
jgi:hypothetical protein